jgi:hypothetical protein
MDKIAHTKRQEMNRAIERSQELLKEEKHGLKKRQEMDLLLTDTKRKFTCKHGRSQIKTGNRKDQLIKCGPEMDQSVIQNRDSKR